MTLLWSGRASALAVFALFALATARRSISFVRSTRRVPSIDVTAFERIDVNSSGSRSERHSRENRDEVFVLVVGREHRENVLVPSMKSLHQHVVVPLEMHDFSTFTYICVEALPVRTRKQIEKFIHLNGSFEYDSPDQFSRAHECFERVIQNSSEMAHVKYFFKTRPDIMWLGDIALPFHEHAIMLRARRISRGSVTSQHLSWQVGPRGECKCADAGCVMVDSMVGVVPSPAADAYFNLHLNTTPVSSLRRQERRDENEKEEDAKLFRLTPDWRQRCPCATDWDEGALTLRLASHEVSVLVSPFNFVLAPPIPGSANWRAGGTNVREEDDWLAC